MHGLMVILFECYPGTVLARLAYPIRLPSDSVNEKAKYW